MQLTVRDASGFLNIPERTLYRFVKRKDIPFHRLRKLIFFNRAELLEWAISRSVGVSPDLFRDRLHSSPLPGVADALERGGAHRIPGNQARQNVIDKIVELAAQIATGGRDSAMQAMLARHSAGPIAIGGGVAIPHVRNPVVLNVKAPLIVLCFLEHPVDFGAKDTIPVSSIFTILCPNARVHLHLLAGLSHALRNPAVRRALSSPDNFQAILGAFRAVETAADKSPEPAKRKAR